MAVERLSQASILTLNKYSSMAAGILPAGDFELISTTVLGSAATSVTFTGLGTSAAAYKHLQLRATGRIAESFNGSYIYLALNSDTTSSNYSFHLLSGNGSSVSSGGAGSARGPLFNFPGATSTSNAFGAGVVDILDFASTSKNKTYRSLYGFTGAQTFIDMSSGAWYNTSAVTSISISPEGGRNFLTGSRFSLYGLRG